MKKIWQREDCPSQDQSSSRGLGLGRGRGLGFGRRQRGGGRSRVDRILPFLPVATIFKPNGIPVSELNYIELSLDEWEALRLKNVEELNQVEAAEKMGISQSTFARVFDSVNKKVGKALVNGCGIKILKK